MYVYLKILEIGSLWLKNEKKKRKKVGFSIVHAKIHDQVGRNVVKGTENKYYIKTTSNTFTNEQKST